MNSVSKPAIRLFGVFLLAWMVIFTFGENRQFQATLHQDERFVIGPPQMNRGLTAASVQWAFAADLLYDSPFVEYYIPFTVLTRLLDHTLYHDWAGGHHLTSVLLHWLNSMLVLAFLYLATRKFGLSLFFAALFAVHPLNVEAVSWLTARKDLVCGTFTLLTLIAYLGYGRNPTRKRFILVHALFLAALLSKSALISLPLVLLLLDGWPLKRWPLTDAAMPDDAQTSRQVRLHLILEKAPMLLLAFIASSIAWLSQRDFSDLRGLDAYSLPMRLAHTLTSYGTYLRRVIWPADLAAFYEIGTGWGTAAVSALVLAALFWLCLRQRKMRPYMMVGLGWFVLTLAPAISLVQIGDGARADRFAYLALVGLFLALVTGLDELLQAARSRFHGSSEHRPLGFFGFTLSAGVLGALLLAVCLLVSKRQAATWESSLTLFEHARGVSPASPAVHLNLANTYLRLARLPEAEAELVEAIRLDPNSYMIRYNMGVLAERRGDYAGAVESFRYALGLNPRSPDAVHSLVRGLYFLGRRNEAHRHLRYALKNLPAEPKTMRELAALALPMGYVREAQTLLLQANQMSPPDAEALNLMGYTFMAEDRKEEAERYFRDAVDQFPRDARGYLNLSRLYIQQNRLEDARVVLEEGLGRAWDRGSLRNQWANLSRESEVPH